MAVAFAPGGYDFAGRAIPTETTGTDLNPAEQGRLSGTAQQNPAAAVPNIQQTNNSILRAIAGEDKVLAQALDTAAQKQRLYGAGGPFIANFAQGVNPLHQYASYNYNISLHAVGKEQFNGLMKGEWSPSNTILHTSGGYRDTRNPFFQEDFFIDALEMESIIGPSDETRSTNAFFWKFKIIEPMGMTLMNRIVAMADGFGVGAAWTQIPYVLLVEFTGITDDGAIVSLPDQRKVMPIKITNIGVRPSLKGTEYDCEAVAYVHEAYSNEVGTAPAAFEVEAQTLEDFFRPDEKAGVNKDGRPDRPTEVFGGEKEKTYKVRSFVSAYNNYQSGLKGKVGGVDVPDKIYVKFAKEILKDGDLVDKEVQPSDRTTSPDRKRQKQSGKQATGADPGGPKPTLGTFSFQAGTHINAIIDQMMQQTKFWRKQVASFVTDKEKKVSPTGVVRGWKIIPEMKILDWDKKRGRYGYEITYWVKVHVKYNREDPNLPKAWPTGVARTYEYQFTGRNQDVLQWDVKFDTAYFASELVYPEKQTAISGPQPTNDTSDFVKQTNAAILGRIVPEAGKGGGEGPNNEVNSRKIQKVSNTPSATGANAGKSGHAMAAANAYDNIYNRLAEMCNAEVTIVGDPALITQEEIFYSPSSGIGDIDTPSTEYVSGSVGDGTGGISVNSGEVHCRLIWKAPTDLQEQTGGYGGNSGFNQVVLNGLWRMIVVKSFFQNGTFTQKFECIRLFEQEEELGKADVTLGLTSRDITVFPAVPTAGNVYTEQTNVRSDIKDTAPPVSISLAIPQRSSLSLRQLQTTFPTVTIPVAGQQGIAAFGQRYDIPTSVPNPAVDPFNLPTGVVIDPATGLPSYQNNIYTGGQKDVAAWKAAVDAKQPFSYTTTQSNGNTGITRYPGT
jgi:hypothetical protein